MHLMKDRIKRLLSKFGYQLRSTRYSKLFTEACNYPEIDRASKDLVIFDVGANLGQTSIEFRLEFPHARIVAFEPFSHIFDTLLRNVRKSNIDCQKLALGNESIERDVFIESLDPTWGTNKIDVTPSEHADGDHIEKITITTVDEFVHIHHIENINILKTDTEGFDLNVIQGAKNLISRKGIHNIISEVSIIPNAWHSNFFHVDSYLKNCGYVLYSLYDLSHLPENGRLNYFNALWKLSSMMKESPQSVAKP